MCLSCARLQQGSTRLCSASQLPRKSLEPVSLVYLVYVRYTEFDKDLGYFMGKMKPVHILGEEPVNA